MDLQKRYVEIEGVKTHYIEAGSGPVLILIHGGGSGADAWGNWRGCLEAYAQHFRVIAVDMPGFGESDRPDPKDFDYGQTMRNRHMAGFVETIGAGKAVNLIGNSMGGATALGIAIERPELVRKLVLMGAAGLDVSNPDPAAKKALGSYDYTPEGMRKLVSFLAGSRFEISDEMVAYRHELTMRPGARAAMGAIHNRLKEDPMTYPRERISSVSCPTLVVGGKEDQVAVLARTYGYLDLIPNSWGFILPHAGHWVMIEAPEAFVAVTTAFLNGPGFEA
ncbi:alpha/beta fold hydrolase [Sphingomonas crocodyli]|uniref:alpha/beta fold hydrolase n=1 Tax=Sphingomonas crocodyli TaxID=1979270 RepID=UPI0013E2B435|nr:alpha/beta hydrolase [Sphingomonas crocodyli]